jgi:hypothetical protein
MKAKLLILLSCFTILTGCEAYDSAFCRGDFCTDTSYMPNAYSYNASYDCGKVGSGMNNCDYGCKGYAGGYLDSSSGGCSGGSCAVNRTGCSSGFFNCKESVWDHPMSMYD